MGELDVVIPAGGIRTFKTDGLGDLAIGSVSVESDQQLAGVILFGGTDGLAGVGNSPSMENGFTGPIENNTAASVGTGIAVMNLEAEKVTLSFQLYDSGGSLLATATVVTLPAMGQTALFVTELEWDSVVDFSDFIGLLKVTSSGKIAALIIQTRPGQFATMPVTPN